jgi:hypothetical protein
MNRKTFIELVAFKTNLQFAHWQASTLTNEHRALGELYDSINELADKFIEVCMGRDGDTVFPDATITITTPIDVGNLLGQGMSSVSELLRQAKDAMNDDLINILADMQIVINRTKYLLKV